MKSQWGTNFTRKEIKDKVIGEIMAFKKILLFGMTMSEIVVIKSRLYF